jgi:hypothetical protein
MCLDRVQVVQYMTYAWIQGGGGYAWTLSFGVHWIVGSDDNTPYLLGTIVACVPEDIFLSSELVTGSVLVLDDLDFHFRVHMFKLLA